MKKSNKILGLACVTAMLTSVGAVPVSAAQMNTYSVSYETLTEAIETKEGETIPAGAVAVTMSIANNTGFNSSILKLNVADGYSVISNNENKPLVQKGEVLAEANVAGATSLDGDTFCLAVASVENCAADGQMFTVYFEKNTDNADLDFVSIQSTQATIAKGEITIAPKVELCAGTVVVYYYVGDTDNDESVNASDASNIYSAVHKNGGAFCIDESSLNFSSIKNNVKHYFPKAACYLAPDATEDLYIDIEDGDTILQYSANHGAGLPHDSHIGERVRCILPN